MENVDITWQNYGDHLAFYPASVNGEDFCDRVAATLGTTKLTPMTFHSLLDWAKSQGYQTSRLPRLDLLKRRPKILPLAALGF